MTADDYNTINQLNRATLPILTAVAFNYGAIGNRAQKDVTPSTRSGTLLATLSAGRSRSAIHRATIWHAPCCARCSPELRREIGSVHLPVWGRVPSNVAAGRAVLATVLLSWVRVRTQFDRM
jgi:hypothetical protein